MAKSESSLSTYRLIVLWSLGTLVAVAIVFLSAFLWLRRAPEISPFDSSTAHGEWQASIQAVATEMDQHPTPDRIRTLREELLMLRVTAEDRDAHLQFILAMLARERGDANADELFKKAREAALR